MHTLREFSDQRFLRVVDESGEDWRGPFIAALLAAFEELRIGLLIGDPEDALSSPAWARFERSLLAAILLGSGGLYLYGRAIERANRATLRLYGFRGITQDEIRRHAARWAEQHAATLVQQISRSTRRGLRRLIAESLRQPMSLSQLSRSIRDYVGLTESQARRFSTEVAKEIEVGRIVSQRGIDRLYRRHVARRADLIARHEARTATNEGINEAYRAANRQGAMIFGIGSFFLSRNGRRSPGPTEPHVDCRCATRLIEINGVLRIEWVTRLVNVCPVCEAYDGVLKGGDIRHRTDG